jgi:hypothetical protein
MYHYIYRITNIVENKYYYGKRSSKELPQKDIGINYFSSSKDLDFLKDQQDNPQNYTYEIVSLHDSVEDALAMEVYLHSYFSVDTNPLFYNKARQSSERCYYDGSGHKNGRALPVDVYNYYTGEIIAENVVSNVWCKEHGYDNSALIKTTKADPSKPHYAGTLKETNRCHTKGIYAVFHGDNGYNKFSSQHIEESKQVRKGHNHWCSIPVDVFDHYTNKLVAANVISSYWSKEHGINHGSLLYTLYGDRSKPRATGADPNKRNYTHCKGYYLRLAAS